MDSSYFGGTRIWGLSAGTESFNCIFGHLGLVFIWSCFFLNEMNERLYLSVSSI